MNETVADGRLVLAEVGLASQPEWVVLITCTWAGVGVLIAASLTRRGHDPRPLAALGIALGPFLYGYARASLREYEEATRPVVVRGATDHGGHLRVLVTVIGEPSGIVDALPVLRLVAPHAARVEIGRLVTYDVARGRTAGDLDIAVRELETSAVFLHDLEPGLVLVPGAGVDVVHRYATEQSVDVVVVVDDGATHREMDNGSGGRSVTVVMGGRPHEPGLSD